MATDDIKDLKDHLSEIFDELPLPDTWEEDWIIIPADQPNSGPPSDIGLYDESIVDPRIGFYPEKYGSHIEFEEPFEWAPEIRGHFPGAPITIKRGNYFPPPDALAFYLPFHYFYPDWWGIYLTVEGVAALANYIYQYSGGAVGINDALRASQIFLFRHEAFHHNVESFATRLEITHRIPLYKTGFEELYQSEMMNPVESEKDYPPNEEALATVYAYNKTLELNDIEKNIKTHISKSLRNYIGGLPPAYKQALMIIDDYGFSDAKNMFAELNQVNGIKTPFKDDSIWRSFPHAFSGFTRITSKINYIVHKDSPVTNRSRFRYLRPKDLKKKLRELAGCRFSRDGGRHEIWETPGGHRFPIPRHPGEMNKKGTLRNIIKQAGLDMNIDEFIRAKA